jgi:hydroxyacylglutathione hydrolase
MTVSRTTNACLAVLLGSVALIPAMARAQTPVVFFEKWIDGTDPAEPQTQVQALDADTFVIRQSVETNFEAPFLYLLFGRDRALLVDTGAGGLQIRPTVDRLIARWLAARHRATITLIIAHSHGHRDHIAGDGEFRGRPDTTLIGTTPAEVANFFGIKGWPNAVVPFDLGGRRLSIIPTPGHQIADIMVYDPRLKILLSGDVLYPGRLYLPVNHLGDARASIDRVAAFAATHPIRVVLGTHIEMTRTAGKDYPRGALAHPDEHRLELPAASIGELQAGLKAPLDVPDLPQVHPDFIISPAPARPD